MKNKYKLPRKLYQELEENDQFLLLVSIHFVRTRKFDNHSRRDASSTSRILSSHLHCSPQK